MGIEDTADWLQSLGVWAVVASIALNVIIGILGVFPTVFLSGANAIVFGAVPGFFISLAGECISAIISFHLYRWGVLKLSEKTQRGKIRGKLQVLSAQTRFRKALMILIARVTPLVPSGVVTLTAAAAGMPIMDFAVVTFLGKIPSIAVETLIGHDLFYLKENWTRVVITLLSFVLIILILKRPRGQKNE